MTPTINVLKGHPTAVEEQAIHLALGQLVDELQAEASRSYLAERNRWGQPVDPYRSERVFNPNAFRCTTFR